MDLLSLVSGVGIAGAVWALIGKLSHLALDDRDKRLAELETTTEALKVTTAEQQTEIAVITQRQSSESEELDKLEAKLDRILTLTIRKR